MFCTASTPSRITSWNENDETEVTSMEPTITEHTPDSVGDFSSQYGSNRSRSYVVANVCSGPEVYPMYGDSTGALVFRTYGPWWINMPSYRESLARSSSRQENDFTSRDFIEISYPTVVQNCLHLHIYETYNPGTLEVVYVGEQLDDGNIRWHRVWKFPEPFKIILIDGQQFEIENGRQRAEDFFPNDVENVTSAVRSLHMNETGGHRPNIHTKHTSPPAARLPRIVEISLLDKVPFPTRHFRLEFDHSTVEYYLEIDTILLYSQDLPSSEPSPIRPIEAPGEEEKPTTDPPGIGLTELPFDVLLVIFSYLDLRSLVQLSSTCRYLHETCLYPSQFLSLNLQPYWNGVSNASIDDFFRYRCVQTRYLSLAWSKSIDVPSFTALMETCSDHLLQLNLACCQYLTGAHIEAIAQHCPNLQVLSLENCTSLNNLDFVPLRDLQHIRSLNVYRTSIDYRTLLPLINGNRQHLERINLGSCSNLIDTAGIVSLLFGRCSNLRSLDLWRGYHLAQNGFLSLIHADFDPEEENLRFLALAEEQQEQLTMVYSLVDMPIEIPSLTHLKYLSELDFGWTDPPPFFIKSLVEQCGQCLIKIFLTACRRINNEDILAVSAKCPQLRQLDILGSSVILEASIEAILNRCPRMEFLDLSFCSKISEETVKQWKSRFQTAIKRSYSPVNNADVFREYP